MTTTKKRAPKKFTETVKVIEDSATSKPTIPLDKAYPRSSIGDSGTRITKGIIAEEYNPNLQGVSGIRVYDEMRRSDGTVRAIIQATTLPIMRARWFVNPATEDPKDIEIATMVEKTLFEWQEMTWVEFLRHILLMLPYGVMPFEKIYDIKNFDGKSYVTLSKLAPRMPRSIQQWELQDGTFGIQQIRQDGVQAQIPGSKLLVFVNEREGNNWWGNSILRAGYKHWYFKNTFYKIDAIAFERQGMGIPKFTLPMGYTEEDEKKAAKVASNLRSSESAYLIMPQGWEAEFMDMKANTTRDPKNSIDHHNKEILISVLAQFLELGQSSNGGSKALSQDHSDLFLNAEEAIASTISSIINKELIPELVNLNFDNVEAYPKLDFSGITRTDVIGLATTYSSLVTSKGINPNKKDEQYLRSMIGLPELTQEEMEDDKDDKEDEIVEEKEEKKEDIKAHEHTHAHNFREGKSFWRKQTFAEQKINLTGIQERMDTLEEEFKKEAGTLLNEAKDKFMEKLKDALDDDDTKAISELEVKFVKDYKILIKKFMKDGYEYGKNTASTEMNVKTPANSASSLKNIDLIADTVAWKAAIDIETKAKLSAVNGKKKLSDKFNSIIQVVGQIDQALEETIGKVISGASGLIINQAINGGRADVFDSNQDKIYALQRSEILDDVTCNFCLSIDGLTIKPDDPFGKESSMHSNCRGIWVEILEDEQGKPEITDIPDNLAAYYGGEPNALIQPPKPIVDVNSPAKEYIDEKEEEKDKKKKKK